MSKPESYPFMRIAKHFGYDYSEVLAIANYYKNGRRLTQTPFTKWIRRGVALRAIWDASQEQAKIRDGVIDWQTGERIK